MKTNKSVTGTDGNKGPGMHRAGMALFGIAWLLADAASAGSFTTENGIDVRWSASASLGSSWRARNADADLVSVGNGGTASGGNDNGDLNFHRNQAYSTALTFLGDIDVSKDNFGLFLRGKGWYDYTLDRRGVPHGSSANGYTPGARLDDSDFEALSKFSGASLLDAYVYGTTEPLENHALSFRLGNQVVNWGESLFIPGINQFGAFDLTAAHRPGAQVKEIMLPLPQLFTSFTLAENLNVEAFYQLAWKRNVLDGCGTYWSPSSLVNCSDQVGVVGPAQFSDRELFNGVAALGGANFQMTKGHEETPKDSGQFGLALRYRPESIDTDLGLYFANYHSRFPTVSVLTSPTTVPGSVWSANPPLGLKAVQAVEDFSAENIKVVGLSASTVVAGASVFGEISRTWDIPVQINSTDLVNGVSNGIGPQAGLAALPDNVLSHGYDRKAKTQAQLSVIQLFPRRLGAESVSLLGEVAYQHWSGIGDSSERYGRAGVFGSGPVSGIDCSALNPNTSYCENDGFATTNAWGYRVQLEASYPNVFANINVKPRLFWSQDVKGYSADGIFVEGRQVLSPGVRFDYGNKYFVDMSYAAYNRNAKYDEMHDRDYYSLVMGINF